MTVPIPNWPCGINTPSYSGIRGFFICIGVWFCSKNKEFPVKHFGVSISSQVKANLPSALSFQPLQGTPWLPRNPWPHVSILLIGTLFMSLDPSISRNKSDSLADSINRGKRNMSKRSNIRQRKPYLNITYLTTLKNLLLFSIHSQVDQQQTLINLWGSFPSPSACYFPFMDLAAEGSLYLGTWTFTTPLYDYKLHCLPVSRYPSSSASF